MMASSTTRPIASTKPKSDSVLIEKPSAGKMMKVPISETGTASKGIRGAPALQENKHDQDDESQRFHKGQNNFVDTRVTALVVSSGTV